MIDTLYLHSNIALEFYPAISIMLNVNIQKLTPQNLVLCLEIVPSTWIDYEKNSRKFVIRFMPKLYTKMKTQKLYKMLENLEESLDDWPTFEIEIRGHAGNVFFQTLK